ncbi:14054_t:CDS:2, partial [Cetraspora pellucida]
LGQTLFPITVIECRISVKIESEVKGYSDVYFQPRAEALVMKKRKMKESKTKKLDKTGDKENLNSAKQLNKQKINILKNKKNIVNNWFNMTEEERYQRDMSSLETPSESEGKIEGSRKSAKSELDGIVSHDMAIIVVDIDSKPQNAINSLKLKKVTMDAQSNKPIKIFRKWTSFFTQLRWRQATFSKYTPRMEITTKNNNALIFDIRSMDDIQMNNIISMLYNKISNALVGAMPHYTKGKRTHLELVFNSEKKQQYYAKEDISLFRRLLLGYILTNLRRSHLAVKVKNVLIGDMNFISNKLKEAFKVFKFIKSIKPLVKKSQGTQVYGAKKSQQSGEWLLDCASTETKRFKRENLKRNNTNGDSTNEEQNFENNERSSSLMKDIADGDVEMLSQEGESLDVMLEKDRNEKNQQKPLKCHLSHIPKRQEEDIPWPQVTEMKFCKNELQSSYWKVNYKCLENEMLKKKIVEKIRTVTDLEEWDYCKCKIQSLIRARGVLKAPKSSIQKLNRKINVLEKKVARNKDLSDLQLEIERTYEEIITVSNIKDVGKKKIEADVPLIYLITLKQQP